METPLNLYRYRQLEDGDLLGRELGALRDSYLFAPSFDAMNDPMEAFYATGGPGDRIINAMLAPAGKRVEGMYQMLTEMIDRFALVSFAGTHVDLPMWRRLASDSLFPRSAGGEPMLGERTVIQVPLLYTFRPERKVPVNS